MLAYHCSKAGFVPFVGSCCEFWMRYTRKDKKDDYGADCGAKGASISFGALFTLAASSLVQADVMIGSPRCAVLRAHQIMAQYPAKTRFQL